MNIVCLRFDSGFHLGSGCGDTYDKSATTLYSDTVSGALCSVYADMGGENIRDFLDSFQVSSAMPIYQGRLFLPLPPDKSCITVSGDDPMLKRIKRLRWIEQPLWEQLAADGTLTIDVQMISRCGTAIVDGNGRDVIIQRSYLEQKVCVGNIGFGATPYFFDKIFLGQDVELGIIYQTTDIDNFTRTFSALSSIGLGTGKTVGNGQFDVNFREVQIEVPYSQNYQLLSLWIPSQEEVKIESWNNSSYQLLQRGGYMAGANNRSLRHFIKNSVWCVDSGAIIRGQKPLGIIVNLLPKNIESHPIWRDGRAISLPFK